jgi:hypothetical protein
LRIPEDLHLPRIAAGDSDTFSAALPPLATLTKQPSKPIPAEKVSVPPVGLSLHIAASFIHKCSGRSRDAAAGVGRLSNVEVV